jgi:hypothetical protein
MHVIKLDEEHVRVIHGALVNELTMDWSIKDLGELKKLIEFALGFKDQLPSLKKAKYKDLRIHEGANHLDIVDHNVGTLNLLTIEDHFVSI